MDSYLIRVRGCVEVDDLNARSPHQMSLAGLDTTATRVSIFTDQSGLLAVLRHLHNLGLTLLSVTQEIVENE